MKPILEIQGISKRFLLHHDSQPYLSLRDSLTNVFKKTRRPSVAFYALDNISFDLNAGESIGIVGKNGAGKSTLLKILSKITPPSSGKIICRGRIASLLEVGTGFHPELSGRENVFLNGSILGMRRHEIKRNFDTIVDFAGVEKFLDTPLKHYSSGMQLRLAFAVAAFLEPEILVIDEVLAVGDSEFQKKCLGKMEEVSKSGRTILFVSHNMTAVKSICTKAVLLKQGKIVMNDSPSVVIEQYLNSEKTQEISKNIALSKDVKITNLLLEMDRDSNYQSLRYSFRLESTLINQISGLAILIDNSLGERMGILDLRHEDLYKLSSVKSSIELNCKISNIPLIEGTYYLGVYIVSNYCQGEYYKLASFDIQPPNREIVPYESKYRGYIEFEHSFLIH